MKHVTPKQLELTAGKTREELLADTMPHIDVNGAAFKEDLAKVDKIEKEEAARAVLGLGDQVAASRAAVSSIVEDEIIDEDDFDWNKDDAVILQEQRATAVYHNRLGELIIRQKAAWDDERDTFVYITSENVTAFLEGAAKKARG
jgi:hypothetical protein